MRVIISYNRIANKNITLDVCLNSLYNYLVVIRYYKIEKISK